MERKIKQLADKCQKIMDDGTDVLIIAYKDGQCGAISRGSTDNIAHSMFASMHKEDDPISPILYRILKLNLINILNNPSKYSNDLIETLNRILFYAE